MFLFNLLLIFSSSKFRNFHIFFLYTSEILNLNCDYFLFAMKKPKNLNECEKYSIISETEFFGYTLFFKKELKKNFSYLILPINQTNSILLISVEFKEKIIIFNEVSNKNFSENGEIF